jgi:hypothetical protein
MKRADERLNVRSTYRTVGVALGLDIHDVQAKKVKPD